MHIIMASEVIKFLEETMKKCEKDIPVLISLDMKDKIYLDRLLCMTCGKMPNEMFKDGVILFSNSAEYDIDKKNLFISDVIVEEEKKSENVS